MEDWLRLLVVGSFLVAVSGDFQCVCNFQVELQVYPDTTGHSQPLGYLYEFDCKQEITGLSTDPTWFSIAFEHQVAYVKKDPQVEEQMCPGTPAEEDKVTTLEPPSTTPTSTAAPATDEGTKSMEITTSMPTTGAPTTVTTEGTVAPTTTPTPPTMAPTTSITTATTARPTTTQPPTTVPTTPAPTTESTTQVPTTLSTTRAPTTQSTTQAPTTTIQPTTAQPVTQGASSAPTSPTPTTTSSTPPPTTVQTSTLITGNTDLCSARVHQYAAQDSGYLTQYNQSCYELIPHLVSWSHAEFICKNRGGHLVTISNAAEQEFLYTFILSHYHSRVWLGLHDRVHEEQFQWTSGHAVTYTNWTPNRKSYNHFREDCVYMSPVGLHGRWDDVQCGADSSLLEPFQEEHAYMCQYGALSPGEVAVMGHTNLCPSNVRTHAARYGGDLGQHGDVCYELLTHIKYAWNHAESYCQQRGGHLAYITSADQQAYVQKFMLANSPNHAVWIGLHDQNTESQFEWTSGAAVTYTNWVPGHVSNFESHRVEDCVAFIPYKNGMWDDIPCGGHSILFGESGETHPVLCQYRTVGGGGLIG